MFITHRSKSIRVTSLFFCQNDVLTGESFWQKDSLVTLILFDLYLFKHFSLSQIFVISLYVCNIHYGLAMMSQGNTPLISIYSLWGGFPWEVVWFIILYCILKNFNLISLHWGISHVFWNTRSCLNLVLFLLQYRPNGLLGSCNVWSLILYSPLSWHA